MMIRQKSRSARPRLEPLEGRELLSGLLIALQATPPLPTVSQVTALASNLARSGSPTQVSAQGNGGGTGGSSSNANGLYIGNTGPNSSAKFPTSPILGTGTPTKAELARERFVAKFSGPYHTLPGRFTDQKQIIYLNGLGGSTPNFFLHGDYALAMVIPRDPTQPITGFAFLDDKNNNSGGVVGLDLLATHVDAKGRPTTLTFTADPNVYGGIFFVDSAAGTVHITYGKNTATTTFNGRIYTSGLTSPFQNVSLYAKHSG